MGAVRAFEAGVIDVPFSPSVYNAGRVRVLKDSTGAVRFWNSARVNELVTIGERMNNLCRCFNVRGGITRKDDCLPWRFIEEQLPDGPSRGQRITNEELQRMLDDYYELRGWNRSTGVPEKEKLLELGLERAAKAIGKHGQK